MINLRRKSRRLSMLMEGNSALLCLSMSSASQIFIKNGHRLVQPPVLTPGIPETAQVAAGTVGVIWWDYSPRRVGHHSGGLT